MNAAHLAAWSVRMMGLLQPANVTPWADTYESTARVFVEEASREPLFSGSDGTERTLSLFLSVAWFEGRFNPRAKGDCKERNAAGDCVSKAHSLCMFQVGVSNLAFLGTSEERILSDVRECTRAARTMMKTSFHVCRERDSLELLGHYASGGSVCGGLRESRHRMSKARWIFGQREHEDT